MISVKWCPEHELVLEETWAGMHCPAGHDWIFGQEVCQKEFWVVDMSRDTDDELFCLYVIHPLKFTAQGGILADPDAKGFDVRDVKSETRPDYLADIKHWARPRKLKQKDINGLERAIKGRF